MTLGDTPFSSSLKTNPKVLKILVLEGYHPTKLIMSLLDKALSSMQTYMEKRKGEDKEAITREVGKEGAMNDLERYTNICMSKDKP